MANPSWPAGLPQSFPLSFAEKRLDGRIRTVMDVGPPKVRTRFTAIIKEYVITGDRWIFTATQRTTLNTFFDTTLGFGALPFDWINPWPSAGTVTLRFKKPIEYRPVTPGVGGLYSVTTTFEDIPGV